MRPPPERPEERDIPEARDVPERDTPEERDIPERDTPDERDIPERDIPEERDMPERDTPDERDIPELRPEKERGDADRETEDDERDSDERDGPVYEERLRVVGVPRERNASLFLEGERDTAGALALRLPGDTLRTREDRLCARSRVERLTDSPRAGACIDSGRERISR